MAKKSDARDKEVAGKEKKVKNVPVAAEKPSKEKKAKKEVQEVQEETPKKPSKKKEPATKRDVIVGLLGKMGVECTEQITEERALAKLDRFLEKQGLSEDTVISAEEGALLKEMGYEVEEVEDAPVSTPEKKTATAKKQSNSKEGAKKETKSSRANIVAAIQSLVEQCLNKKPRTRAEVIEFVLTKNPDLCRETVSTMMSHGKNPKYNPFHGGILVADKDKKLTFVRK